MKTETQIVKSGEAIARRRLAAANKRMGETAHLPPGNEVRDAAVRELRDALAIASEWEVIPSAMQQINGLRRRREHRGGF